MNFPDLISLASGYGDFPVPAVALAAAGPTLTAQGQLPVSPIQGLPALREALAARYRAQGARVTAEQVVVTLGAKPALFALLKTLLQPGDEVLLPTPNWFGFRGLVANAGGTLRTLPLSAADDYALTPEALRAALTPATRVLLLSNPNNPTGRLYQRAELAALLAVTREFERLVVISDEIYDHISFGPVPLPSLLEWPDPLSQHVVVNGFSKSLALVGWGVGYLIAPAGLAQACAAWQFATSAAVPVLSQQAALAATQAAADISATLRTRLAPARAYLLQTLAALPGVRCSVPEGTYYAFPDFTAYLDPALPPAEASARLFTYLKNAGVELVDGATCDAPGFARISCAVPEPLLREGLRRLSAALAALPVNHG
ncbi:pyridoxal phosphate-dependent aminotransferase [Hymenobacter persicinus]|uniref:Aminotransferase class I/II-fold pyridoxal phosphate-dependent enzyme n=1 Tax=Hymenobacter persicinus TaxID=2025506 RepID=A0A4Q5L7M4_9BACT|nr:aminotransferase class I/II-fold pyridoxal phosphate-dependent enzyme [Hymenobacter persicinus]RYU77169.1 aminotransferase class I/II-fold pyridoxal phosphate-dependent enzyme [Hymenobacter persicinus]